MINLRDRVEQIFETQVSLIPSYVIGLQATHINEVNFKQLLKHMTECMTDHTVFKAIKYFPPLFSPATAIVSSRFQSNRQIDL